MCWKSETMLRDIPPGQIIQVWRERRMIVAVTAHDLIFEGRMSGTLCLDQVEWAFNADDVDTPGYCPQARRDELMAQTAGDVSVVMAAQ